MPAFSPEILKNIRRIEIETNRLVNELFAGAYHSAFKGRGIEFEDIREYVTGDDVRSIDWNVAARTGNLYIKSYKEERELTVTLVVDVSSSSRFGSISRSKNELMAEIGAVLAFSAIKNSDKVGLILFSNVIEKYIPPKKGLKHVLRVIRELLIFDPTSRGTNVKAALVFLGKVQRRGGICFLISDFICPDFSLAAKLTARTHDLIAINITDSYEMDFPGFGLVNFSDLETSEIRLIDTSNAQVKDKFQRKAKERILSNQKLMEQIGAGFISVKTDQTYAEAIRKYFTLRNRKK